MSLRPFSRHRNTGFSLVEIMVGMVIGLLSTIIVMQVFATFEGQKRTSTSGSDAQTNGGVGLYTIERDVRMAGYGFADAVGCAMNNTSTGLAGELPQPLILAPVVIGNGAGTNGSDTLTIIASNKTSWSVPVRVITNHAQAATQFNTNATLGIAQGDLLIAYQATTPPNCTLFQVDNADPVLNPIVHAAGSWNGNSAIFPAAGYSTDALLINAGSFMMHTYSLDANSNLVFGDYSSATNTTNSQILSPDIVSLQAEYGFDTRAGVQTDARVDTWSATMIDADVSGTTGDTGDINRIYALRFAVVARSGLMEKPLADGSCDITTVSPTWTGGAIDLTALANWQCYRYKTFETVVPLRNMLWR